MPVRRPPADSVQFPEQNLSLVHETLKHWPSGRESGQLLVELITNFLLTPINHHSDCCEQLQVAGLGLGQSVDTELYGTAANVFMIHIQSRLSRILVTLVLFWTTATVLALLKCSNMQNNCENKPKVPLKEFWNSFNPNNYWRSVKEGTSDRNRYFCGNQMISSRKFMKLSRAETCWCLMDCFYHRTLVTGLNQKLS